MTESDRAGILSYLKFMALFSKHPNLNAYGLDDGNECHVYIYAPARGLANIYEEIISQQIVIDRKVLESIKSFSNSIWFGNDRRSSIKNAFSGKEFSFVDYSDYRVICSFVSMQPSSTLYLDDIARLAGEMEIRLEKITAENALNIQDKGNMRERVFIVHGHDNGLKDTVARYVSEIGLEPVILHEQANKGRTIIEKLEEEVAQTVFGIVIYTPDDRGNVARKKTYLPRARQNVIFEHGFLMSKLGRDRVCCIVAGNIEKPSDNDGVLYIEFDDKGGWKSELKKELMAANIQFKDKI